MITVNRLLDRLLRRMADLVIHRPALVRTSCVVALVLAALGIARGLTHLETDYLALLPVHKPEVKLFREAVRDFGTLDFLVVLLTAPPGQEAVDYGPVLDELARSFRESPHVSAVEYKLELDSPLVLFLLRNAILYMDPAELDALEAKLTDEGIAAQVRYYRQLLSTPAGSQAKLLIKLDPLGLLPLLQGRLMGGRPSMGMDLADGYYVSRDRTSALMIVKPVRPAQDVDFDVVLFQDLEARVAAVLPEGDADLPSPDVRFGGGHAIALDDYRILKRDAAVNFGSSFASVLALFVIALGGPRCIKFAALPLALGVIVTGGIGGVLVGSFNPATAGFAALLIGLAVDHIIVMTGRYAEERGAGAPPEGAARTIVERTGRSVALGAVTTAATFLALCIIDFKGLADLGLLAGIGILVCFAVIVVLVPHLLLQASRKGREVAEARLRSFGVERVTLLARRAPRATLGAAALATAACLLLLPRIHFEDDLKALRAEGNRGIETQRLVSEKFGGGFDHAMLISRAADVERLLERATSVDVELARLVEEGIIDGFDSISRYVPPIARQEQVLARIGERRTTTFDAVRVRETLTRRLQEAGFRSDVLQGSIDTAVEALAPTGPITAETLRSAGLGSIVERFLRVDGSGARAVAHVFPSGGAFHRHVPEPLREAAAAAGADLTGVTAMSEALRSGIKSQAATALVLGLVVVTLLVALDFRSVRVSALVMAPLLVGVVWMTGVMNLAGVSFNFFNVFVATMILGIGVDYSIHATHRYLEGGRRDFDGAFLHTGRAIVLAALTTMLGFGSFATSHYRGLFSIGVVAIIGTTTCLLASFTVLPALLCLIYPPRQPGPRQRICSRGNDGGDRGARRPSNGQRPSGEVSRLPCRAAGHERTSRPCRDSAKPGEQVGQQEVLDDERDDDRKREHQDDEAEQITRGRVRFESFHERAGGLPAPLPLPFGYSRCRRTGSGLARHVRGACCRCGRSARGAPLLAHSPASTDVGISTRSREPATAAKEAPGASRSKAVKSWLGTSCSSDVHHDVGERRPDRSGKPAHPQRTL